MMGMVKNESVDFAKQTRANREKTATTTTTRETTTIATTARATTSKNGRGKSGLP